LKGNLLLNETLLLSFDRLRLPTDVESQIKSIKAATLLRTLCMIILNVLLDVLLLYVAVKYKHSCSTLPFHFIELMMAFSSIGIIICLIDMLYALCAVSKPEKTISFLFCLQQLKVCLSTTRNILLMLATIPLYYIKSIPKEGHCSEWYEWAYGIMVIQLLFYALSIIIKSGAQIFGQKIQPQTTE
jgi:hypothetical protein